tara:strand:+ start:495 stop:671 length:177 start_codon:yes stop_codon:yes gene_type:complete
VRDETHGNVVDLSCVNDDPIGTLAKAGRREKHEPATAKNTATNVKLHDNERESGTAAP